jgi:hypothetical protein
LSAPSTVRRRWLLPAARGSVFEEGPVNGNALALARVVEEYHVLKYKAHGSYQGFGGNVPDVFAADTDFSLTRIPKTGDKPGQGSLAGTGGAHECGNAVLRNSKVIFLITSRSLCAIEAKYFVKILKKILTKYWRT